MVFALAIGLIVNHTVTVPDWLREPFAPMLHQDWTRRAWCRDSRGRHRARRTPRYRAGARRRGERLDVFLLVGAEASRRRRVCDDAVERRVDLRRIGRDRDVPEPFQGDHEALLRHPLVLVVAMPMMVIMP
jgi:hypothetical protein